jgi:hypothetical protein
VGSLVLRKRIMSGDRAGYRGCMSLEAVVPNRSSKTPHVTQIRSWYDIDGPRAPTKKACGIAASKGDDDLAVEDPAR